MVDKLTSEEAPMSVEAMTAANERQKGWDSWDENEVTEALSPSMNQKDAIRKDLRYIANEIVFLNYSYNVFYEKRGLNYLWKI